MRALVAGPDATGLGEELREAGADVVPLDGAVTARTLREAGVDRADVFVLTDPDEATGIPLARELHPDLAIVVYADRSLPPFASHLADLIIDPTDFEQSLVVEEILGAAAD